MDRAKVDRNNRWLAVGYAVVIAAQELLA